MTVFRLSRPDRTLGADDWRSCVPLIAGMTFFAAMFGLATHEANEAIIVYALSFWQYLVYALGFLFRSTPLWAFKRDAVLTRSVSLIAFAWVYFAQPLSLPSLVVVGLGFLLNAAAVRALGVDRTYYGYELEELPPKRVVAFPYTWIPHPMLVGNMAAFGGALLNGEFRSHWLPLAVAHVLFNLAIILMEAYSKPKRTRSESVEPVTEAADLILRCFLWGVAGGLAAAAMSHVVGRHDLDATASFVGACSAAFANALFESYSTPRRAGRVREVAFTMS